MAKNCTRILVLLPGMDGTGWLFQPFREALGSRLECVVVSYPTDRWLSYKELENWALVSVPPGTPYVLLADSFSGPVAIGIASRRPAGLRGVVLCASFVTSPGPRWLGWLAGSWVFRVGIPQALLRALLMSPECPSSLVAAVSEAIDSVQPAVLARRLRAALKVDVRRSLEACEVPLLYVAGGRDRILGMRGLKLIEAVKPDVKTVVINGPHLLLQCRPHDVVEAVEPILQGWLAG